MRKLLIAVLAVLGVVLAAVLVLPGLIDWNSHKDAIAARITAATGRAVSLDGDISLSLFPSPKVSVAGARLANPPGFALPDMAVLKRLDVTVSLMPLLGGRVQVESLTFIEPLFVFETGAQGAFNWDFGGGTAAPAEPGDAAGQGFVPAVSFDEVSIENGTVLYRDDRTGKEERVESLDARVVAASLAGPFQMHGTFRLRNHPVRGEVTTGRFTEGAAVPVRAALTFPEAETTLRFAGIAAAAPGGGTRAQGDLRAEGANLASALAPLGLGPRLSERLAQGFSLRAAVEGAGDSVAFNSVEFQVGDMRASGTASLDTGDVPRAKVALTLNRLDLDTWLARPAAQPAPQPARGQPGPSAEASRPPADFALPRTIMVEADLVAEAVTFNGALIRQARLEAALADGVVTIERAAALLPGGSDIVAGGSLSASGGQPAIDLRMEANADNLRGVLEWLKQDVRDVPADRLRKASLSARIQGRPGRLDVTGIDLRVDTSRITGGVAYVDRGRPAYGVRLDIDRLNKDAYLPPRDELTAGGAAAGGGAAPAPAPAAKGSGPLDALRRVDANLQLNAGHLTFRNMTAQGLALDATATSGAVVLRELRVADLAGVSGRASGRVGRLAPFGQADLTLTAEAASLAGLARFVAWPAAAPTPERLGPVKVQGRFGGDLERLTVDLDLAAAGGTLELGGTLADLGGAPQADVKLRTTHPELGELAALFTPTAAPAAYGPIDLYGELRGGAGTLSVKGVEGMVAGVSVRGEGAFRDDGTRPRVELDLQTGDIDIDRLSAQPKTAGSDTPRGGGAARPAPRPAPGGDTIDLSWLNAVDGRLALTSSAVIASGLRLENPAMRAVLAEGVLTLEQLDGGFLDGQVGATGRLAAPADGMPQAQLDLTVVKAKPGTLAGDRALGIGGGTLDLDAELSAFGRSSQAMLQSLSGQGRIAARDGLLRGFDLAALAQRLTRLDRPQDAIQALARALQGGDTPFASLDGSFTVERGVVRSNDLALVSPLGDAAGAGQMDLPAGTIDAQVRVQVRADGPVPPLTLRLTGPLDRPTRSFDLQEVQAFLARRAAEGALERAAPGLPIPGDKAQGVIRDLLEGLRR